MFTKVFSVYAPEFLYLFIQSIAVISYVALSNFVLFFRKSKSYRDLIFFVISACALSFLVFFENLMTNKTDIQSMCFTLGTLFLISSGHFLLIQKVNKQTHKIIFFVAQIFPVSILFFMKIDTEFQLIGYSYLAFRMVLATNETRVSNGLKLSIWWYLSFLLFPFTFLVGPISPLRHFTNLINSDKFDWDLPLIGLGRDPAWLSKINAVCILLSANDIH